MHTLTRRPLAKSLSRFTLLSLSFGAVLSATCACSGEIAGDDDDLDAQNENVEQVRERLFNTQPSPIAADITVRAQRLAYRCGISICTNTHDYFGSGIDALRAPIPAGDEEDIYVAFPNGHPTNPSTVILLSSGMQDIGQNGYWDSITGQENGWRLHPRDSDGDLIDERGLDVKLLGNSLRGRLAADPRVQSWGDAYVIVVLDNGAGWSDPSSREIHQGFAAFVRAKIGTNTKRVILGGYSRGGIMVADMGRHLRYTPGIQMSNDIGLFVANFDGVAGGGGKFGVESGRNVNNPLIDNSNSPDFMKETSEVEKQIKADKRRNITFYYNDVSGGRIKDWTMVHGFGSLNYDVIPNFWTEHWETLPHTDYKDAAYRARILDPFMDWFTEMDVRARPGIYTTNHNDQWIGSGATRDYYLEAKQGSTLSFQTTWDGVASPANLDIEVYSSSNSVTPVAAGRSTVSWKEEVSYRVPTTDTYRVRVFAKSEGAPIRVFHTVQYNPASTGYILLPSEAFNSVSGFRREFKLPTASTGKAINLELTWNNPSSDLDLYLYNKAGALVAFSNSYRNSERISYRVPASEGPYKIEVKSHDYLEAKFEVRGTAPLLTTP